jgi:hypothetical protein
MESETSGARSPAASLITSMHASPLRVQHAGVRPSLERSITAHGSRSIVRDDANLFSLKDKVRAKIRKFEEAVGVAATQRGRSRASAQFGLLYAAGCFARHHGILPRGWDCLAACIAVYRNYQAQLPSHTPLLARLLTIAQRQETLDLRSGELSSLSDAEVSRHGAFLHLGVGDRVELLITDETRRSHFSDWSSLSQTPEFDSVVIRASGRRRVHRQIRCEPERERLFCFVLPKALADQL